MNIKKIELNIPFIVIFTGLQLLMFLLNPNALHFWYLFLINSLFCLYFLRSINKLVLPVIALVGFGLSIYFSGIFSHEVITKSPGYLETINQLRGGSGSVGVIFFNKLTYIYFYLKNVASYVDLFFWVEKVGLGILIVLFISILVLVKKFKWFLFIPLLFLLPSGLLVYPLESLSYLLFIPIISFVVTNYLLLQKDNVLYGLIGFIVIFALLQIIWPVKIIL